MTILSPDYNVNVSMAWSFVPWMRFYEGDAGGIMK
jgi:hypothetical protein